MKSPPGRPMVSPSRSVRHVCEIRSVEGDWLRYVDDGLTTICLSPDLVGVADATLQRLQERVEH